MLNKEKSKSAGQQPARPEQGVIRVPYWVFQEADTCATQGNLTGVACKDGIEGKGGMPPSFCVIDHALRKLRVAGVHGPQIQNTIAYVAGQGRADPEGVLRAVHLLGTQNASGGSA